MAAPLTQPRSAAASRKNSALSLGVCSCVGCRPGNAIAGRPRVNDTGTSAICSPLSCPAPGGIRRSVPASHAKRNDGCLERRGDARDSCAEAAPRRVGDLLRHYVGALRKDQHRVAAVGETHKAAQARVASLCMYIANRKMTAVGPKRTQWFRVDRRSTQPRTGQDCGVAPECRISSFTYSTGLGFAPVSK
jgi:hypothetical protein